MKPTVRIIQNCYRPEQLSHCSFEPHFNPIPEHADERYLFCESNVISKLINDEWHRGYDYFGVLGHAWIEKLQQCRTWSIPIKNISRGSLTAAAMIDFVQREPSTDFAAFAHFVPHRVFQTAEQIHPGWKAATSRILDCLGIQYNLDCVIKKPIYFNFFVGRSTCMEAFVRDLLHPAMEIAINDPIARRLCFEDAGYFRDWPKELSTNYQLSHYPLHPFIGERLINIYADLAQSSIKTYNAAPNRLAQATFWIRMKAHQAHWAIREARMKRRKTLA